MPLGMFTKNYLHPDQLFDVVEVPPNKSWWAVDNHCKRMLETTTSAELTKRYQAAHDPLDVHFYESLLASWVVGTESAVIGDRCSAMHIYVVKRY